MSTPASTNPPEEPTTATKVVAVLFSLAFATLAALIAFSITRHLGAKPLIALGSAGVTLIATLNAVQNIMEKFRLL
ncbi:hypothetical protein OHA57_00015 [Streptomyces anulatus]|uniref:hypothetical protein n=1 Tax=Streptomyces anulatus TaxID=1892 RepID=UPI002DDB03E8|nr:hypothetical protein [Streptomyces anulatus]WSC59214.1 hypothetical protein OHA57_00015 [Streptomyces anulatus]